MQPWEVTKTRAIATLTVWTQHAPSMAVGGKTPADPKRKRVKSAT